MVLVLSFVSSSMSSGFSHICACPAVAIIVRRRTTLISCFFSSARHPCERSVLAIPFPLSCPIPCVLILVLPSLFSSCFCLFLPCPLPFLSTSSLRSHLCFSKGNSPAEERSIVSTRAGPLAVLHVNVCDFCACAGYQTDASARAFFLSSEASGALSTCALTCPHTVHGPRCASACHPSSAQSNLIHACHPLSAR